MGKLSKIILLFKAILCRTLMSMGMKFHLLAQPKPIQANFTVEATSRLSTISGNFKLIFYLPSSYHHSPDNYKYPVVVNFHGGGFTLGKGTDDARWASSVVTNVDAILVSVEYRLAPEYPFSVGVEDAANAVLHVAAHAEEFRIDPHRIALSGFSSGGNFALSVPILLKDLQNSARRRAILTTENDYITCDDSHISTTDSSMASLSRLRTISEASPVNSRSKLLNIEYIPLEASQSITEYTLLCLVSFYPPIDFRQSRDQKRATNPKPELNLTPILTNLFDLAYLPLNKAGLGNPYLSPAAASDETLKAAYPDNIILYTCEYDMLSAEGVEFGIRLASDPIRKYVHGGLIKNVPHAFDRKPNPINFPKSAQLCYDDACARLKRIFEGNPSAKDNIMPDLSGIVERFKEP